MTELIRDQTRVTWAAREVIDELVDGGEVGRKNDTGGLVTMH